MYTARQEGAEETRKLLDSLSRTFRYVLGSNDAEVPLSREIQIVDAFYSLYHARLPTDWCWNGISRRSWN